VRIAGAAAGALAVGRGICQRLLTAAPIGALLPSQALKAKISGNTRFAKVGNGLGYRTDLQTLVVEPWGRDGLRVRVAKEEILDTAWALMEPVESIPSIEIDGDKAIIRNGIISARIQDIPKVTAPWEIQGLLRFFRQTPTGEECILSEYDYITRARVDSPGTRILRETDEGLYHAEVHFEPSEGERFYGLGQNANGRLDQKGFVVDLYQCHVKAVVPFLVSNRGYGFLWNNPGLGRVDLGYDRTRWTSYGCKQIDYYICAGHSYGAVMERYAEVTGHPPMLPYWASGFWQCKLRYKSQEELLGVAREYKQRNLPLSVIVIDFLHWKHFGDWKLDPEFWPDPESMVRELDAMGVRVMISPWILITPESENYAEMESQGMFITSDRGAKLDPFFGDFPTLTQLAHYDPTNPQAAQFLWSRWKANYFDKGIRTFWLDPCDTVYDIGEYADLRYHIGRGVEVHNYFPIAYQEAIHDGLKTAGENEVVMICRSVWAGSQRYGAALWSGDILSSFQVLSDYMRAGLNVAMSGIPWWTTDIGGFMGGEITSPVFRELIVRWYQYGVFCPLFRTHGARPGNEAWSFGEEAYRHIRRAMLLRERLRPYVMKQMKAAHERGLPPMRPIFFDFPEDKLAAAIEDEFLLGPDVLIAPILNYRARSREVYLPNGAKWRDAWTGRRVAAGRSFTADAPLERIPVYVREESRQLAEMFRGLEDED
jgi:alpha-D-xyloside xylohydrolase